jgi:hypothetical protein
MSENANALCWSVTVCSVSTQKVVELAAFRARPQFSNGILMQVELSSLQ